jgi:FkbM family methyltransferase
MLQLLKSLPPVERWRARKGFWKSYNESGEWELKELPTYVPKDRIAIDVGGNTGVYSFHLGRLARDLVIFEPNPAYVDRLKKVGFARQLQEVALSDHTGEATLRIPMWEGKEDAGMGSLETTAVPAEVMARSIKVPIRRLDDYGYKDVGFIKIDVEGHEEGVLKGGLETIRRERPVLLIEIEERHNPGGIERVRNLLAGYDGYFFLEGVRRPIDAFDAAVHQLSDDLKVAVKSRRQSAYVNNFLFVPAGAAH